MIRGERVLFREVSLAVNAGDALVLRGANGAGKTTLLRILAGLTRPEAGRVARETPHHWIGHREGLKPQETPREHLKLWAHVIEWCDTGNPKRLQRFADEKIQGKPTAKTAKKKDAMTEARHILKEHHAFLSA